MGRDKPSESSHRELTVEKQVNKRTKVNYKYKCYTDVSGTAGSTRQQKQWQKYRSTVYLYSSAWLVSIILYPFRSNRTFLQMLMVHEQATLIAVITAITAISLFAALSES